MNEVARNVSDSDEGFLLNKRYLIHDRDPLFTEEVLEALRLCRVQSVKLTPQPPNLNAYAERFGRTIKESYLERMLLFGEGSSRKAIHEFVEHNRQRFGTRLITENESLAEREGPILRQQRLGGTLNYYYRKAA